MTFDHHFGVCYSCRIAHIPIFRLVILKWAATHLWTFFVCGSDGVTNNINKIKKKLNHFNRQIDKCIRKHYFGSNEPTNKRRNEWPNEMNEWTIWIGCYWQMLWCNQVWTKFFFIFYYYFYCCHSRHFGTDHMFVFRFCRCLKVHFIGLHTSFLVLVAVSAHENVSDISFVRWLSCFVAFFLSLSLWLSISSHSK